MLANGGLCAAAAESAAAAAGAAAQDLAIANGDSAADAGVERVNSTVPYTVGPGDPSRDGRAGKCARQATCTATQEYKWADVVLQLVS